MRTEAALTLAMIIAAVVLALQTTAQVDLLNPLNNTHLSNSSVMFEYYVNLDNIDSCRLLLDEVMVNSSANITNASFNNLGAMLGLGPHSWLISCEGGNETHSSEQRTLTIDQDMPTVIPFVPFNATATSERSINVTYVVIDDHAINLSCSIIMDNTTIASHEAQNSRPTSMVAANLTDGEHNWTVSCTDNANNTATGETRTYIINTTQPQAIFELTLSHDNLITGQGASLRAFAPIGTTIRSEACPDANGFVECKPIAHENITTMPYEKGLPFTNQEGKYILETFFTFENNSRTIVTQYNVTSNIDIDIEDIEDIVKNQEYELEADIEGGVGNLRPEWKLSNGTIIAERKVKVRHSTAGNYTHSFTAKDEHNNTRSLNISVKVEESHAIKVIALSASDNAPISNATVDIEGEDLDTDASGAATFYLAKGSYDLRILATNHSIYDGQINVTQDSTYNFALDPIVASAPAVQLISPLNNSAVDGPTVQIYFRAQGKKQLNCSAYITEGTDGFFIYLGSTTVPANDAQERGFEITDLDSVPYYWKVECVDTDKRSGSSETWTMNVGGVQTAAPVQESTDQMQRLSNRISELELLADDIQASPDKDAADELGINTQIEQTIIALKNAVRDIDGLQYRNDITEEQKASEKARLEQEADAAYQNAPVDIEITGSDSFVDYINTEELEALIDEYAADTGLNLTDRHKAAVLEFLEEVQQQAVISTDVRTAKISYKDGSAKDITAIIRDIRTYNLSEGAMVIEIVPKEIAESATEIKSNLEFTVLREDPIIAFPLSGDLKLSYYLEKAVPIEDLKNIRTAVFVEPDMIAPDSITGFAILPAGLGAIRYLFFVILLGGLVFAGFKYDGVGMAKVALYSLRRGKDLHYISNILKEMHDHISSGNHSKAIDLYSEAKQAYTELSPMAKNDIYDSIVDATSKLQEIQGGSKLTAIEELVGRIENALVSGDHPNAVADYGALRDTYKELDGKTQEMLYPSLVDLGNKINSMVIR